MEDRGHLLARFCVATAVHLASYLAFHLKKRDGTGAEHKSSLAEAICLERGHNDGLLALQNQGSPVNIIRGTSTMAVATMSEIDSTKQFPAVALDEEEHRAVDKEAVQEPNSDSSAVESQDKDEILRLRDLVQSLLDRNAILETKMLEYFRLKEQESAVRELEDRLKITSAEADCLSLEIEFLKKENERLKLRASKSSSLMRALEPARMKLEEQYFVHVQEREKIASLEKSIGELLDTEGKNKMDEADVQGKLNKLKELEEDAARLRRENLVLAQENLDLAQRLKSAAPEDHDQVGILEERQLKEENEKLKKKTEQLETGRCADVEELVYVRWLNACLRDEQREHQPPPGTVIAKDLSKWSSSKSEEKFKQLVLHYTDDGLDYHDDEQEEYSCSDQKSHAEPDSFDDSFLVKHVSSAGKSKFTYRLKKLLSRKTSKNNSEVASVDTSPVRRASISTCSIDKEMRRGFFGSTASCFAEEDSWTKSEARSNGAKKKRASLFGGACRSPRIVAGERRVRIEKEGIVARCKSDLGASYNRRTCQWRRQQN